MQCATRLNIPRALPLVAIGMVILDFDDSMIGRHDGNKVVQVRHVRVVGVLIRITDKIDTGEQTEYLIRIDVPIDIDAFSNKRFSVGVGYLPEGSLKAPCRTWCR